ncbi:MAG: group II intron reverse transcriptase/maturase [Phycisphaerales bacterium]|nr:MAG: group II intron reverse transcriptase/maturase [Phycisphaerales bacterium]
MKPESRDTRPVLVPRQAGAKQAGEVHARWGWTEPAVWTDRMLAALERGIKGGVWFSLIDKVYSLPNLRAAFAKVKANGGAAGCDHQTIAMYEADLETNLEHLSDQLRSGVYRPRRIRRVYIPKPGSRERRPLGIPTVRDRIVQTALGNVIEPIFERDFAEHSYGFRPNRGCKDALRRVDTLLKAGYTHVVDADLKSYFDTIPHQPLMERVGRKIADGRVLELLEAFLTQGVLEGLETWTPTSGSPQGAVISPLLSNAYLDPLDQLMAEQNVEMVRYADDFVILCRSTADARDALERVQRWTASVGLTLHPEKTQIVDANLEGFDFLGYHFQRGRRWPRDKSIKKFRDAIRAKTPRKHGHSLCVIIANVNWTMRGWFEYFKHASHVNTFRGLDGWIRRRLRRILLKRHKKHRHNGLGNAHHRWPNAFFAEQGLFSMEAAYDRISQSAGR